MDCFGSNFSYGWHSKWRDKENPSVELQHDFVVFWSDQTQFVTVWKRGEYFSQMDGDVDTLSDWPLCSDFRFTGNSGERALSQAIPWMASPDKSRTWTCHGTAVLASSQCHDWRDSEDAKPNARHESWLYPCFRKTELGEKHFGPLGKYSYILDIRWY